MTMIKLSSFIKVLDTSINKPYYKRVRKTRRHIRSNNENNLKEILNILFWLSKLY